MIQVLLIGLGILVLLKKKIKVSGSKVMTRPQSVYMGIVMIVYGILSSFVPVTTIIPTLVFYGSFLAILIVFVIKAKTIEFNDVITKPSDTKRNLIIALGFIGIITTGFFAWQYLPQLKLPSLLQDNNVVENEDKIVESTIPSGWITHTNQEHGFTFSVPKGSEVVPYNMLNGGVIRINLPKKEGTNLREKYLQVIGRTLLYNCSNPANTIISESETVYVDNIEGSILKEKGSEGAAGSAYLTESYSFENNRKCFALVFGLTSSNVGAYSESEKPQEYNYEVESKVFKEILSTFRFLEEQQAIENKLLEGIDTKDWIEYRSDEYNIGFKYPKGSLTNQVGSDLSLSFEEADELYTIDFFFGEANESLQDYTEDRPNAEDVLVGGIESKVFYGNIAYYYYIPIDNLNTLIIWVTIGAFNSTPTPGQIEILNKVMSTFKFID